MLTSLSQALDFKRPSDVSLYQVPPPLAIILRTPDFFAAMRIGKKPFGHQQTQPDEISGPVCGSAVDPS